MLQLKTPLQSGPISSERHIMKSGYMRILCWMIAIFLFMSVTIFPQQGTGGPPQQAPVQPGGRGPMNAPKKGIMDIESLKPVSGQRAGFQWLTHSRKCCGFS
jgi:hypothetical protein